MSLLSKIGKVLGFPEVHITTQSVKTQIIEAVKPDFDKWVQAEALALEGAQATVIAGEIIATLHLPITAEQGGAFIAAFVAKQEPLIQGKLDALLDAEAGVTPPAASA